MDIASYWRKCAVLSGIVNAQQWQLLIWPYLIG